MTLHAPPAEVAQAQAIPGRVFGRYVLVEVLGVGGAGEVWKSWDLELSRWVALKLLVGEGVADDVPRFHREAQAAARLSHPNIAPVYDAGEFEGRLFIALQYIDGYTLQDYLLPLPEAVTTLRDAALALQHAHERGVIHRDVKPSNIMKDAFGRTFIMDFGLARTQDTRSLTLTGLAMGTPSYMSPEQVAGKSDKIDERVDVYGLGATLYCMVTGQPPFSGQTPADILFKVVSEEPRPPRALRPDIPEELEWIILHAMEKDRDRRYLSARELAEDLDRHRRGLPVLARPLSPWARLGRQVRRHQAVFLLSALSALLAILLSLLAARHNAAAATEQKTREAVRPHLEAGRRAAEHLQMRRRDPDCTREEAAALAEIARRYFEDALALDRDLAEAHVGIGISYARARNERLALEFLDRAVRTSPEFPAPRLERARLHLMRHEHMKDHGSGAPSGESIDQARADLERVAGASPIPAERKLARALLAFASGEHGQAISGLTDHLRLAPGDTDLWYLGGHSYVHLEAFDDADRLLSRSLACDPFNPWALADRGALRIRRGKADAGIHDLELALQAAPPDWVGRPRTEKQLAELKR